MSMCLDVSQRVSGCFLNEWKEGLGPRFRLSPESPHPLEVIQMPLCLKLREMPDPISKFQWVSFF
jgi:hypothetical protein